jgi:hypothetical protein
LSAPFLLPNAFQRTRLRLSPECRVLDPPCGGAARWHGAVRRLPDNMAEIKRGNVRLFERHGFVAIPRYNDNPDANLFMELDLAVIGTGTKNEFERPDS